MGRTGDTDRGTSWRGWRNLSIKTKVPLIVMTTSAVALVVACGAFLAYHAVTARRTHARNLRILAEIISAQSAPAVAFGDQKTTREILSTLGAERQIVAAAVYGTGDRRLSGYTSSGMGAEIIPDHPGDDGTRDEGGFLVVVQPILQEDRRIGTVYLRSDASVPRADLNRGILIVVVTLLLSSLTALLLSLNLGRFIVLPILNLARTVRHVSDAEDYSVRAVPHGRDETGQLILGFNKMLSRIEEHDDALRKNVEEIETLNRTLEERQRELGTYHDLVTHDVTNFAGTLMVIVQHLMSGAAGPLDDRQRQLIQRANRQIFQLNRLAENAKTLVRLREKGLPPFGPPVVLQGLLQQVVETVRSVHFDRSCRFRIDCPETLRIPGLPLMENILLNVLDNAVRHSAPGDVAVEIGARPENGAVEIAVRGGKPVEPDLLSRIFERYERGPQSKGGGLGLSVVREILQRSGGAVRAGEARTAEGPVFEITLRIPKP